MSPQHITKRGETDALTHRNTIKLVSPNDQLLSLIPLLDCLHPLLHFRIFPNQHGKRSTSILLHDNIGKNSQTHRFSFNSRTSIPIRKTATSTKLLSSWMPWRTASTDKMRDTVWRKCRAKL